jgi:predicted DNA-binding protein with PD1-like motif
MRMVVTRLREGQDLKESMEKLVRAMDISAATVISAVGTLNTAVLRMAFEKGEEPDIRSLEGPLEIVSAQGNIGPSRTHLHMSVSDRYGRVVGGHVKEGCIVDTTLELVLAVEDNLVFAEEVDTETGFGELSIQSK